MPTVLITGASSGLGLAFLRHYATQAEPWVIIAVDRNPLPTDPAIQGDQKIRFHQIDLSSEPSILDLARGLGTPKPTPIDVLIHSAGIRGLVPSIHAAHPNDVARAETLENMTSETMLSAFTVNTLGTFLLPRALLPNLLAAGSAGARSQVLIMGSRMGSVERNVTGGAYAYRASKAALNTVVKSFSIDVPQVHFAIVHPGRVETGLVRSREEGAIEADESVQDMVKLTGRLGKEEGLESGCYVDRFGVVIPW